MRAVFEFKVHSLTVGSSLTGEKVFFVMSDFGEEVTFVGLWIFVDSFDSTVFEETLRDVNAAESDSPRLVYTFFVFSTCQSGSW